MLLQRANLFQDICRALPDNLTTFCPVAQGVLWDGVQKVISQ